MLRSPWNKMKFLKVNLIVYNCIMLSLLRVEKKCIIYFYIWMPPLRGCMLWEDIWWFIGWSITLWSSTTSWLHIVGICSSFKIRWWWRFQPTIRWLLVGHWWYIDLGVHVLTIIDRTSTDIDPVLSIQHIWFRWGYLWYHDYAVLLKDSSHTFNCFFAWFLSFNDD